MTGSATPSRSDLADGRPRKKRKSRPQLSCNECRRLKLKCDRQSPCGSCIRRECETICVQSDNTAAESATDKPEDEVAQLQHRLAMLEDSIRRNRANDTTLPSGNPAGSDISLSVNRPHEVSLPSPSESDRASQFITNAAGVGATQQGHAVIFAQELAPNDTLRSHPFNFNTPPSVSAATEHPVLVNDPSNQIYHPTGSVSLPHHQYDNPSFSYDNSTTNTAQHDPARFTQSTHPVEMHDQEHSHGTLVISRSGRSKYLGRTAAAEWLKNQETVESGESPPPVSQMPSPRSNLQGLPEIRGMSMTQSLGTIVAFPFNTASRSISTSTILSVLPSQSEGRILIEAYFRHFSWHFNIASRSLVDSIVERAYAVSSQSSRQNVPAQQLALLFVIFAVGAYYNLELSPDDSSVEDYVGVSQACLAKGDFLANNTTAGVQTLHIMAHLLLSMDSGKNGDSAWPLWGLTAHITLAMGLHRDGARWNLPEHAIEERRRVFWECHSTEIMSCNCFSRPGIINPDHVDTAYPKIVPGDIEPFHRTKYELSHLFAAVLDHSSKVNAPPYSSCIYLHDQICIFEKNVPFELRCRPVLCALPSAYPAPESAIAASPTTDKRNLHLTFQQFTLAMNISELIVFLNRPYFAQALHDCPGDPTRSKYGQSYLAVVERCNAIVVIATNAYALYPHAAARHWWIWYHAFSSAICMGTLVMKNPQNVLSGFAKTLIDNVINVYQSVVRSRNSPRMVKNLHWLRKLREKLAFRLAQSPEQNASATDPSGDGEDDAELLGWRTRLISRAGQGSQVSRTIRADSASTCSPNRIDSHDMTSLERQSSLGDTLPRDDQSIPNLSGNAWELEFNQFWDSMVHNDGMNTGADPGSFNWWGLDALTDIERPIEENNAS